ncbi:MAG: hypothetical protein HC840_22995 [Leptolyngbyaceae cyanobacterium RM2_2_4]|nr:hypothetical protein [Leptolyngbyaceae cyanobacterium RM2_2_4]
MQGISLSTPANRVSFDFGFVSTRVGLDAIGTGGDVVITTRALSVTNGAELLAETSGRGGAGDVIINAAIVSPLTLVLSLPT